MVWAQNEKQHGAETIAARIDADVDGIVFCADARPLSWLVPQG